jgi:hypothetical protein
MDCHERSRVGDATRHGARCDDLGTRNVRTCFGSLPTFKVAVGRGNHAFAVSETLATCEKTHRAAGFTPFETGVAKDNIETLGLGLPFDRHGSRHTDRANAICDFSSTPTVCVTLGGAGAWVAGLKGAVRVITVGQSYVAEGQKVVATPARAGGAS